MILTVTWDNTDEIILQRAIKDNEIIDPDFFLGEIEEHLECSISVGEGYVPYGCGDISVELADNPKSGACWTCASYMLKGE